MMVGPPSDAKSDDGFLLSEGTMGNLAKNWPVYILMAGFIWLVAYVYITSNREEKKKQDKEKGKR